MSANHNITLYHLNRSRSFRIFWVLEELGLPYKVKVVFRQPNGQAPPELRQLTGYPKAPVVSLDGEMISESAYIIQRLLSLQKNGSKSADVELTPSNESIYWSHWAEGTQMMFLQGEVTIQLTSKGFSQNVPQAAPAIEGYAKWMTENYFHPQSQANLDHLDKWFSNHPNAEYFSGNNQPGLGDFMLFFAIHSILDGTRASAGYKLGPKTQEWFKRVMARPACERALKRLADEEESQSENKASL